jgi:serine/threonine-protein kinase
MIAGTPEYMSPEQCRSLAVGPSTDLYAIGCVLTELLQLAPPFRGGTAIDIISRHLFLPPPPLSRPQGAEPVPPLLERLRLDLLAKEPSQRPQDIAEIRSRLYEAMSAEATAKRLPARKADEPLGGRADRLPAWERAAPTQASVTPANVTAANAKQASLIRLRPSEQGVTPVLVAGLSAQGIAVIADPGAAVVILDAADDLAGACAELSRLAKLAPAPRVVVCAAGVTPERMNQLIAAGAADVASYPVTADVLGKKVDRVLRRKR